MRLRAADRPVRVADRPMYIADGPTRTADRLIRRADRYQTCTAYRDTQADRQSEAGASVLRTGAAHGLPRGSKPPAAPPCTTYPSQYRIFPSKALAGYHTSVPDISRPSENVTFQYRTSASRSLAPYHATVPDISKYKSSTILRVSTGHLRVNP
eukprot:1642579-Rhodomonas_salina.2